MDQLDILYEYVIGVGNSCSQHLESDKSISSAFPEALVSKAGVRANLEIHFFAIFMASLALRDSRHESSTWERFAYRCVDRLLEQFRQIQIEGNDLEEFIAVRMEQYGRWTDRARKATSGERLDLVDGWMRMFRNNIFAAWDCETLPKLPPRILIADYRYGSADNRTIVLRGFLQSATLQTCLDAFFYRALYPLVYRPIQLLCQRSKDILTMSPGALTDNLSECCEEAQRDTKASK